MIERQITCKICGINFIGFSNKKYCIDCIVEHKRQYMRGYMNKYYSCDKYQKYLKERYLKERRLKLKQE